MMEQDIDKEYNALVGNFKSMLARADGREVIWYVLSLTDMYSIRQEGDAYNEGRRSIGVDILQMLEEVDPTLYPQLLLTKHEDTNG